MMLYVFYVLPYEELLTDTIFEANADPKTIENLFFKYYKSKEDEEWSLDEFLKFLEKHGIKAEKKEIHVIVY